MDRSALIMAARGYAPPLFGLERVDRRGARLWTVSPRAIEYARNAGLGVDEVWPEALGALASIAPKAGTIQGAAFAGEVGLPPMKIWPPRIAATAGKSGAARAKKWPLWAIAGAVLGSAFAGPVGLLAGAVGVGLAGARSP